MNGLYREEVIESQRSRLYGDVVLTTSKYSKVITALIAGSVLATVCWGVLADYARTEPVRGIIVPEGGASKVYAMRSGVLKDLMVREGDVVKAGQNLATVSIESPNATGSLSTAEGLQSLQTQREIIEEQIGLSKERADLELVQLEGAADGLIAQRAAIGEQISIQKDLLESNQMTFDQLRSVVDKGFVSKLEYERRRQSILLGKQEMSRLRQQMASIDSDLRKLARDRQKFIVLSRTEGASSRTAIEGIRQQSSKVASEASYLVQAPVSGRVTAVQVEAGQAVGGSIPILVIMPINAELRAELYIPTRAIGFVKPGQEVRILYDAFPYQKFGSFEANIISVSQVSVAGSEANAPFKIDEPVYRVTAKPKEQHLNAYGNKVYFQPGMTLVANIVLERQTFVGWFLSPINAVANRS